MKVRKAVIPAAGKGTRFLPATKAQPKEMLPIVDTPTIQFVVEEAVQSGLTDILIITGKDKRSIEDHFDRSTELERHLEKSNKHDELSAMRRISDLANIHYIRQSEQCGLGHAIRHAREHVGDEPFAVLLGDTIVDCEVPATKQLIDTFEKFGGPVIGLEQVPADIVDRYGIIAGDEVEDRTYKLSDMVEKPSPEDAPSNLAIGGRYVLTPDIFDMIDQTQPGKNNEIQLTDAMKGLLSARSVYGYQWDGTRYDIGNRFDYMVTQIEFGLRRKDIGDKLRAYLSDLNL